MCCLSVECSTCCTSSWMNHSLVQESCGRPCRGQSSSSGFPGEAFWPSVWCWVIAELQLSSLVLESFLNCKFIVPVSAPWRPLLSLTGVIMATAARVCQPIKWQLQWLISCFSLLFHMTEDLLPTAWFYCTEMFSPRVLVLIQSQYLELLEKNYWRRCQSEQQNQNLILQSGTNPPDLTSRPFNLYHTDT